jgi:hypothetical protein
MAGRIECVSFGQPFSQRAWVVEPRRQSEKSAQAIHSLRSSESRRESSKQNPAVLAPAAEPIGTTRKVSAD